MKPWPRFPSERTLALMLDMKVSEVRRLVEQGALPPPVAHDRWDAVAIERIMTGEAAKYGGTLDF